MNFVSREQYKVLTEFRWDDIANLSIVTGLNGVGKTQLLDIIAGTYYNHHHAGDKKSYFEYFDPTSNGISVWNSMYSHLEEGGFNYNGLELLVNLIYDYSFKNINVYNQGLDSYIDNYIKRANAGNDYRIKNMCGRFAHVVMNN